MDQIQSVVKEEVTTPQVSETTVTPSPEDGGKPAQPGDKTDPNLLLKSLQDERAKNKKLEEELARRDEIINSSNFSEDMQSDEGKQIIEKHIAPLRNEVTSLQDQLALKDLQIAFPALKDLSAEFDEYRKDYPRHKLENVAKMFLQEKGLLETPAPIRQPLERTTGGPRQAPTSDMSAEDVKRLRETNYKEYQRKLMAGEIKV